jgi:hypothetical protein
MIRLPHVQMSPEARYIVDAIDRWRAIKYTPPIGSQEDRDLAHALSQWRRLSGDEKERMVECLLVAEPGTASRPRVAALRLFSHWAATLAVREHDLSWISLGLDALGMDDFRADWRDSLIRLPLLYRSAEAIGENPDCVFEEAAQRALSSAASIFRSFLKRSPEDRSIGSMGYIERNGPDGVEYVRTW